MQNVAANSLFNYSGANTVAEDTADRAGFYIFGSTAAAGSTSVRGVWAVNAG